MPPWITRTRSRRVVGVLVSVAALSLVAVGCGGSTGGGATSSPSASASVAHWSGPAPNTSPMSAADAASIDKFAASALKFAGKDLPGLWLGVWDPQKGMHVAAYGKAAMPDTVATANDHGRIGSTTKTFTAAAILGLVDEGRLGLDDTIADVLPELAAEHPDVAGITVKQLLGMTSGIPDYANLPLVIPAVIKDPAKVWTAPEIVDLVLAKEKLEPAGTPGYSTTNYLILGEMIGRLTGRPVEQVLTELAGKNGLVQTALTAPGDNAMPDPFSHGYINSPGLLSLADLGVKAKVGTDVTTWSASWGGAGGGMYSTVEDLGRWAGTGFGNTGLTPATVQQRLETTKVPGVGDYGLGIIDLGSGWIGHNGQLLGWESIALYNMKTGAVYTAIVNETGSLTNAILAIAAIDPALGKALL